MLKTAKIIASGIIYRLSGKRILTKSGKDYILEQKKHWREIANMNQQALDREHSSGHGICAFDGSTVKYSEGMAERYKQKNS